MKLGFKIGGGFSIMIAISIVIGISGWLGISKLSIQIHEIGEACLPSIESLLTAKGSFMLLTACQRTLVDPDISEDIYQRVVKSQEKAENDYREALKKYGELPKSGEETDLWEQFQPRLKEWEKENTVFMALLKRVKSSGIKNPQVELNDND